MKYIDFKKKFQLIDSSLNKKDYKTFEKKGFLEPFLEWIWTSKHELDIRESELNFKTIFYYWQHDILEQPKCLECGKKISASYKIKKSGKITISKVNSFCSRSCDNKSRYKNTSYVEKIKNTWGSKSEEELKKISDKRKNTSLERYGIENPANTVEARQLKKIYYNSKEWKDVCMRNTQTNIEKYGVKSKTQLPEIKEKIKKSWSKKTQKEKKDINNKRISTNTEKYGTSVYPNPKNYLKIKRKIVLDNWNEKLCKWKIKITKYSSEKVSFSCGNCLGDWSSYRTTTNNLVNSDVCICPNCNSEYFEIVEKSGVSNLEKELTEYVKKVYDGNILENTPIPNSRKTIDIYLPDLRIGIEFNGLYWHGEFNKPSKTYHKDKKKLCKENNILLINIWEDDWRERQDIVKSLISNKLGVTKKKIGARCCEIRIVSHKESKDFLIENHLQGYCNSSIRLGLYHNNCLVTLVTFGKSRNKKNEIELLRFCSKLNCVVMGGFSKLLSHFLKTYEFEKLMSYANGDISNGNVYVKNGFNFVGETVVGYYWAYRNSKFNRFKFRKQKLVEQGFPNTMTEVQIMHSRGYYRIYDCGNEIYELNNKKGN